MSHHVFISFSSRDREAADRIRQSVEQAGPRCWISSRDVGPGENYQAAIVNALQGAPVFMLVFSGNSNDSPEVHKEVSLASAYKKVVIPVRIVDTAPTGAMAYELATRQWIDAFGAWDEAMQQLVGAVQRVVGSDGGDAAPAPPPAAPPPPPAPHAAAAETSSIFSREELETARTALALYVGPIAEMLVRKASAEARSVNDLHKRLALHITHPEEQAAFLQKVKRRFS